MLELNPARGRKGFIAKLSGMYEVRGTSEDAFLLLSGGACSSSIANFTISKHWNTQSIFVTVSERHRNSSITHDHNLSTTMRSIEACVILRLRCCIEVKVQIREIWQVQAIPCMWIISLGVALNIYSLKLTYICLTFRQWFRPVFINCAECARRAWMPEWKVHDTTSERKWK